MPEQLNPKHMLYDEDIEDSEEMRLYEAQRLGLPPNTSREDIRDADDEHERKSSAKVLNLPEDATWDQIWEAENGEGERVSRALLFGLDRNTSHTDINKERQRRRKELLKKIWS